MAHQNLTKGKMKKIEIAPSTYNDQESILNAVSPLAGDDPAMVFSLGTEVSGRHGATSRDDHVDQYGCRISRVATAGLSVQTEFC